MLDTHEQALQGSAHQLSETRSRYSQTAFNYVAFQLEVIHIAAGSRTDVFISYLLTCNMQLYVPGNK